MVRIESMFSSIDNCLVKIHPVLRKLIKSRKSGKERRNFVKLHNRRLKSDEFKSLVPAKPERNFLIKAMVSARISRIKFPKIRLCNRKNPGRVKLLHHDIELTKSAVRADVDRVDKLKSKIFIIDRNAFVETSPVFEPLVEFSRIKRSDKRQRHVHRLCDASRIGGKNSEPTSSADSVLLVVKLNCPISIRSLFGKTFRQILPVNRRIKFIDVFNIL